MISNEPRSSGKEVYLVSSGSSQPPLTRQPSKPDDPHKSQKCSATPELRTAIKTHSATSVWSYLSFLPANPFLVTSHSPLIKTPVIPHIPPKTKMECRLFLKGKSRLTAPPIAHPALCYLLFAICYLLFAICYLLFAIPCLCPLPIVHRPLPIAQSAIRNPQSAIRNPQSAIRNPHLNSQREHLFMGTIIEAGLGSQSAIPVFR
jgi:hypothetical protein